MGCDGRMVLLGITYDKVPISERHELPRCYELFAELADVRGCSSTEVTKSGRGFHEWCDTRSDDYTLMEHSMTWYTSSELVYLALTLNKNMLAFPGGSVVYEDVAQDILDNILDKVAEFKYKFDLDEVIIQLGFDS